MSLTGKVPVTLHTFADAFFQFGVKKECLRLAQRAVQEWVFSLHNANKIVVRAQKRLDALDEERANLVSELAEGHTRLQQLRVEVSQKPPEPNSTAASTTELGSRASVAISRGTDAAREDSIGAQQGRTQLGPRQVEEELQDLRWEVDALWHKRDSLVAERVCCTDTTMAVVGVNSACFRSNGRLHRRRGVEPRRRLHRVRVGEAADPPRNLLRLRGAFSTRPEPAR